MYCSVQKSNPGATDAEPEIPGNSPKMTGLHSKLSWWSISNPLKEPVLGQFSILPATNLFYQLLPHYRLYYCYQNTKCPIIWLQYKDQPSLKTITLLGLFSLTLPKEPMMNFEEN
tara:strand:- start:24 stop:368 length:345 start_codon:yes stop_codon:yes gene_type:complete